MKNTFRCNEIRDRPLKKYVVLVHWDQQLREFHTFGDEASIGEDHSLVIFSKEEVIAEYRDWKMWYIAPKEAESPVVTPEEPISSLASES